MRDFKSRIAFNTKKKGLSVETDRPLTIACHMKKLMNNF